MTNEDNKTKWIGEIRNSQLVTTYGCGALCDFPDVSGIISSIRNWKFKNKEKFIIHEPNLENILGKKYFIQMISPDSNKDNTDFFVPVYRFPEWYYCPECGSLNSYKQISYEPENNKILYCEHCYSKNKVKLNPSRFIIACANGHLEDFPYLWWVHENPAISSENRLEEEEYKNHKLQILFDNTKEGLDSIVVKCLTCENNGKSVQRNMLGCLNSHALDGYKCQGKRPWLIESNKTYRDLYCAAKPRTLLRSGNNVYYPVTESAITLPDAESVTSAKNYIDENKTLIEQYLQNKKNINEYHNTFKYGIEKLSKIPENIFVETYNRFFSKAEEQDNGKKRRDLIKAEYNALCQNEANDKDKNFKIKEVSVPKKYSKYISKLRLVKKLREVQVLKGFNRILPEFATDDQAEKQFGKINNDFVDIDIPIDFYKNANGDKVNYEKNWLPAIQLIGEGIFIELNQKKLQEWITFVSEGKNPRYNKMKENLMKDPMNGKLKEKFSEQYVLLHTLSHLLIRQLAYDCGYNTASLKEKIYTTFQIHKDKNEYVPEETKMAGILIYTASTDSDGSLGGLVRQGETENFEKLLDNTLENAYWCSNDPVCSESTNQGYRSLNYAACHACTLLPETSCESFNSLLDRASVIGVPGSEEFEDFGYFNLEELRNTF